MSFIKKEISFPSSDGIHTIFAKLYEPSGKEALGVLQLAHGMIDYVERYEVLAEALCEAGFILAGNDHLGHGKSAGGNAEDYGFFADRGGVELLLSDMKKMNSILHESYPSLPVFLMGHSMGSFLSRLYAVKYPESISGHIIHGTGGPKGIILPMGKLMVKLNALLRGNRNRSGFIASLAFSGYNKRFPKEEGKHAWLTRDIARVSVRDDDEYTGFTFTDAAYYDLFTMTGRANSGRWFKTYPKNMPTLIMSGDADPVGDYGKAPSYIYTKLLKAGCTEVELKLYKDARHELFNELCREEAFADMIGWLKKRLR